MVLVSVEIFPTSCPVVGGRGGVQQTELQGSAQLTSCRDHFLGTFPEAWTLSAQWWPPSTFATVAVGKERHSDTAPHLLKGRTDLLATAVSS